MADDLQAELSRLDERAAALGEDDPRPRGALPGLFRALREADLGARAAGLTRLGRQLADAALIAPAIELAREGPAQAYTAGFAAAGPGDYCVQEQAAALAAIAPSAEWTLAALELLLGEGDPTELALAAGAEETCAALEELLRLRLRAPARRRDRTSALLAEGALRALAALVPDQPPVQRAVAQILTAEARRAQGEPALALAALDALRAFPPAERLRLLQGRAEQIKRRKVQTQLQELLAEAEAELGLSPVERLDLLARQGGLDDTGLAPVDLDEGGRIGIGLTPAGGARRVELEPPGGKVSRTDERALASAEGELLGAWSFLAERLELALVEGREWRGATWTLIFRGPHPLWADLVPRLVWERRAGAARTWFRVEEGQSVDVFGESLELGSEDRVALAHPSLADPEELELWREWAACERPGREPFLQLYRPVSAAAELQDPDERFSGRELYREAVTEWARREGFQGAPLVGVGPWELWRELRGVALRLELAPVAVAFKATLAQRKTAHRRAREGEKVVIRGHAEAQPRATIASVEVVPGSAAPEDLAVVLAELSRALEELTEELLLPDELWLRAWQQEKWHDPAASWKEVVLRYRQGSGARVALRRLLLTRFAEEQGWPLRLEDRFAITRGVVVELGTGRCHEGPPKDYLPQWKVDERLEAATLPELAWPFVSERDPETRRIVELVLGLLAYEAATPAESPQD